jgi:hypothetical protein
MIRDAGPRQLGSASTCYLERAKETIGGSTSYSIEFLGEPWLVGNLSWFNLALFSMKPQYLQYNEFR